MAEPPDSIENFRGQPWSNWTDFLGRTSPIPDEECDRPEPDCMRLPREDMGLFGLCPATDPLILVVCELCNKVVKPQGISNHYDKWHKSESTDALPPPEPPEKVTSKSNSSKGGNTSKLNAGGSKVNAGSSKVNVGGSKVKVKRPARSSSKDRAAATASVEEQSTATDANKLPLAHADGSLLPLGTSKASTSAAPTTTLQPVVALTPLGSPSNSNQPVVKPASATSVKSALKLGPPATATVSTALPNLTDSSSITFPVPGPSKKRVKVERKCLPVREREYDPDKHCGVWNGESSKPCTRSLTCKSHTLSMRRAVTGRSKNFDKLLADHKAAKDSAKSGTALPTCQPTAEAKIQTASPQPPGRVVGSIQQEVSTSLIPASLSTSVSTSIIAPTAAPKPSLGSLTTTPLPSLPDLSEDAFEMHSVPVPPTKKPLHNVVSLLKDTHSVVHTQSPPQVAVNASSAMVTTSKQSSSVSTSAVSSVSTLKPLPKSLLPSLPNVCPAKVSVEPSSVPVAVTVPTTAVVKAPPTVVRASAAAVAKRRLMSAAVPVAVAIPRPLVNPLPTIIRGRGRGRGGHVATIPWHERPTFYEDVTWLKHHPRPLAMCTFASRKVGSFVCNNRRFEVVRDGLREALAHGPVRSPINDFYGSQSTSYTGGTFKPILANSKTNFLSPGGKIIIPGLGLAKGQKVPILPSSNRSGTGNFPAPSHLKAVLPKPQPFSMKDTVTPCKDSLTNGNFHIPNILSGSLKRNTDSPKAGGRKKRKVPNVNAADILQSILANAKPSPPKKKNKAKATNVPLVTVALANGLTSSSTSTQCGGSDSKAVRTTIASDTLRAELTKGMTTSSTTLRGELSKTISTNTLAVSETVTGAQTLKAVTPNVQNVQNVQNVRIAAAPNTVQLATPQITYLTTGPVTFQQIPVLSPQVISQIQLQSKTSGGSQSIPLKLLSGSIATAAVLHQEKDHSTPES